MIPRSLYRNFNVAEWMTWAECLSLLFLPQSLNSTLNQHMPTLEKSSIFLSASSKLELPIQPTHTLALLRFLSKKELLASRQIPSYYFNSPNPPCLVPSSPSAQQQVLEFFPRNQYKCSNWGTIIAPSRMASDQSRTPLICQKILWTAKRPKRSPSFGRVRRH